MLYLQIISWYSILTLGRLDVVKRRSRYREIWEILDFRSIKVLYKNFAAMEKIYKNRLILGIIAAVAITAVLTVFFFCEKAREDSIKIGAVLSLSGAASVVGEEVGDGMLMAVNEINPRGGVNKKNIELIIQDSKTGAQKAEEALFKNLSI